MSKQYILIVWFSLYLHLLLHETSFASQEASLTTPIQELLDVRNAKFFHADDDNNIDFGFSVSLFYSGDNSTRKLLVGAPLANTRQDGVVKPGAVYSCDLPKHLNQDNECSQLVVDTRNAPDKYSSFINTDAKDFQRLGASLVSSKDQILVCAPNWHYYEIRTNSPIDTPVGTCFKSSSLVNFKQFSVPYDLYGDKSIDYLRTGSCQSGFSAALTSENEAILGSPGCYNWQGDIFTETISSSWTHFGKNFTKTELTKSSKNSSLEVEKKLWVSNIYTGYSVAHGQFNGKFGIVSGSPRSTYSPSDIKQPNGEPLLVVSPMINIFFRKDDWLEIWTTITPPKGRQGRVEADWLFSYFGYSLTVADVDDNGLDDVIVGAPYYQWETKKDVGAILIFMQEQKLRPGSRTEYFMIQERIEDFRIGEAHNGRFGSCVSSVGDLDGDQIPDIAVGAPYSSDGGRVYIYLGSKEGLAIKPNFILSASDEYMLGKITRGGFGASIAPSFMVKMGSQSDLAIGAAHSDVVLVIQSKVMILVEWKVKLDEAMDLNSRCTFNDEIQPCTEINTCLSYEFLQNAKTGDIRPKEFLLSYNLDKDYKRLFFSNGKTTKTQSIYVEFQKIACFKQKVFTNKQIGNFDAFEIFTEIEHIPRKTNDKSCLHHSQIKNNVEHLEIVIDCHSNDVTSCKSDIRLQSECSPTADVPIDEVKFVVTYTLTKREQPSYSTNLKIETDSDLEISGKASVDRKSSIVNLVDCRKFKPGFFDCHLGNFLNEHDIFIFNITFTSSEKFLNIVKLRNRPKTLSIKSYLTSLSEVMNMSRIQTQETVSLSAEPELLLTKDYFTEFVYYDESVKFINPEDVEEDNEESIGPTVSHSYKIYNPKNYPIENNMIILYWPYEVNDKKTLLWGNNLQTDPPLNPEKCEKGSGKGQISDQMRALPNVDDLRWYIIQCRIASIEAKTALTFTIESRIVMNTLKYDIASEEFDEFSSFLDIKSNAILLGLDISLVYHNHIVTLIEYKNVSFGMVPWWMIVAAIVIAIVLLAVIIGILFKCNFFSRKKTAEIPQQADTLLPSTENEDNVQHQENSVQSELAEEFQIFQIHKDFEEYDNVP